MHNLIYEMFTYVRIFQIFLNQTIHQFEGQFSSFELIPYSSVQFEHSFGSELNFVHPYLSPRNIVIL